MAQVDDETWTALDSLNGGEVSHKLNCEVMLLMVHPAIYDHLAEVFQWNWAHSK